MNVLFFTACILCVLYCVAYCVCSIANRRAAQAVSLFVMSVIAAGAVAALMLMA